jgi:glycosyltransferase involved in cell wall biosynthesis
LKTIRVLHIFAPTFGHTFSGHNKLWVRSFQKWADAQVNHQILFVDSRNLVEARTIKSVFGQTSPAKLIVFPRWYRALWAFKLLWLLILKRRQYDILHVHNNYWGGLLVAPLSKIMGCPCIFQITRMGEDDPTSLAGESLGNIKLCCLKHFDRIIGISESLVQECLHQGLSAEKVPLLINAVDNDVFSPLSDARKLISLRRKLNIPEGARVILSVGSVIHRKGTDLLVDAFFSLARDYPDLYLVLVGPATKDESAGVDGAFVEGLRQKITNIGLKERVIFTGRIDDDFTIADYYRAANVFAFPTHQEGLPNALQEALSTGLPVVATHLVGITDLLVKNDETGFLIPSDDVPALREKLQWILNNPDQARKLGDAARIRAIQHFGFDVWQKKLTSIYYSMLTEKSIKSL